MALDITTIDTRNGEATALIDNLRERFSPRGDIVSDAGRRGTVEIFGEPSHRPRSSTASAAMSRPGRPGIGPGLHSPARRCRPPQRTRWSFPGKFSIPPTRRPPPDYLATIRQNSRQLCRVPVAGPAPGRDGPATAGQRGGGGDGRIDTAVSSAGGVLGVCVPGGAAAYPSTLLMTAVPGPNCRGRTDCRRRTSDRIRRLQHRSAGGLPRTGNHRGVPCGRGPGGLPHWPTGSLASRRSKRDRRAGQPVRRPGQATGFRRGGHRFDRRPQRGGGAGRRDGRPRTSWPATCFPQRPSTAPEPACC
ncbi:MAG: hypothetical protein CM1200mP2_24090 [Planctomycetaceae bacterium]|nr:MAG: hypothetical protein CM1200mP2_24090 [Planctomycetaceae bacterium]